MPDRAPAPGPVRISNSYTRRPKLTNPYAAPELVGISLAGTVHGHTRKADGERVVTSRVVRVAGRIVYTESGTKYEITGAPDPRFLEHLASIGREYDAAEPIRMIGASR